ncbi:MAG: hypothetical protein [Bacteriophage sp.]|nr:MAG: hypothetical protein [Bacteriophage sp.]
MGVCVYKQDALPCAAQARPHVKARRGFSYAAFLVYKG